jgi:hypothetical protein
MMPLHHRRGVASSDVDRDQEQGGGGAELQHQNQLGKGPATTSPETSSDHSSFPRRQFVKTRYFLLLWLSSLVIAMIFAHRKFQQFRSYGEAIALLIGASIVSTPIFLALGISLGVFDKYRIRYIHQQIIPCFLVASIVGNQLSSYLTNAVAATALVLFGLSTRPTARMLDSYKKQSDDYFRQRHTNKRGELSSAAASRLLSGPMLAVLSALLMIAVLLTENFFIWVVSATYYPSHAADPRDLPEPLQDNGRLVMKYLFETVMGLTRRNIVYIRRLLNVQWDLVTVLGLALVTVEMHGTKIGRNLWKLAIRALLTMSIARAIRTVSFLITVLPSQNPRCFFSHENWPHPVPEDWPTWLIVGIAPNTSGGCNDLIISGHATVTSTMTCVAASIVGLPSFTAALWMLVAMDYSVEVFEGFHYSVDMWLGCLLVNLIWRVLAPVEEGTTNQDDSAGAPRQEYKPLVASTANDIFKYAAPAFVGYLQVTRIIPLVIANVTIALFVAMVVLQISRQGFQQYSQHCLFCLLYTALGVYL